MQPDEMKSLDDLKSFFTTKKEEQLPITKKFAPELASIIGCSEEQIAIVITPHKISSNHYSIAALLRNGEAIERIALGNIVGMTGCCGACISTASYVYDKYRNRGIGSIMNRVRAEVAREFGYTVMICTDVIDNYPQQQVLKKNGWVHIASFVNNRTGHDIGIHIKALRDNSGLLVKGTWAFAKHYWALWKNIKKEYWKLLAAGIKRK